MKGGDMFEVTFSKALTLKWDPGGNGTLEIHGAVVIPTRITEAYNLEKGRVYFDSETKIKPCYYTQVIGEAVKISSNSWTQIIKKPYIISVRKLSPGRSLLLPSPKARAKRSKKSLVLGQLN